ncbi:MAG: PAS domain S-box protein [Pseudomonadota bacterium]|nr:PAS domain S-box protein [Pseudomonadota bacterium]
MISFKELAQKAVLAELAPACALIDPNCKVLAVLGPASDYLEMPSGEPTGDLLTMARPGLKTNIRDAVHKTVVDRKTVIDTEARVNRGGELFPCRITFTPLTGFQGAEDLILVSFKDRPEASRPSPLKILTDSESPTPRQREYDPRSFRRDLLSAIAKPVESSIERKASGDDVTTARENLDTSKHKRQSVSEKSSTINNQFQARSAVQDSSISKLTDLLYGTNIPIIFLDLEMRIRYFTPVTVKLLDLVATDIGRQISDIRSSVIDQALLSDIDRVIKDPVPLEREICTENGKCYLLHITPRRILDDHIAGVIVMLVGFPELIRTANESRRMATVLAELNESILAVNLDGGILDWNKGATRLYGYTETEARRMSVYDLLPESERDKCRAILNQIAKGERIDSFESRRMTKDGRELEVWTTITRQVDEAGAVLSVTLTERDITQRKQAEEELVALNERLSKLIVDRTEALHRSEQEFRTLADCVPALFSYVDANQRYRYVNQRYEKQWGRPVAEIVGTTVEELLGPHGFESVRPHIEAVLSGRDVNYEAIFDYADGPRAMQVNYVPDMDEKRCVKGFFALITDITKLKQTEAALRSNEQRVQAIVNSAAEGIITMDKHGLVRDFNPAAEHIFGYTTKEMLGRNVNLLLPPAHRQALDDALQAYVKTGKISINGKNREVIGRRKDGTSFPMELVVSEIDKLELLMGLVRDVSERKNLEREIIQMSTFQQERIGREIHDGIGQQLTGLSMIASSLERRLTASRIKSEAGIAKQLVVQLQKTMEDAKAIALGLSPVEIDPEGLADALSRLIEDAAKASGIHCRFLSSSSVLPPDAFTAVHLYRIAQEALNNALKHAGPDNVEVGLEIADQNLVLSVRDDGTGIKPSNNVHNRLGLHTMKYRADIIGGNLSIEPRADGGTLVRCTLSPIPSYDITCSSA